MSKLSTPVTIIALGDLVPAHLVVKATKGTNGLKAGSLYHPLAVNHKGELAVSNIANVQELVGGPKGHWHPMISFDWEVNEAAQAPANDN